MPTPLHHLDEDGRGAVAGTDDIGRPVGPNERELFISCDPEQAIQQQFERQMPEFIAVHGMGTPLSRRLLEGMAAASERPLQTLTLRRQGLGTVLAVVNFVNVPNPHGADVRIYTTEASVSGQAHEALASTLLAFSRLAVLLIPDMSDEALGESLRPLHEQMRSTAWRNRHLLLMPLSSVSSLAVQGVALGRSTTVNVRATPRVASPADAWGYISATWSRLGSFPAPAAVPEHPVPPSKLLSPANTAPAAQGTPTRSRHESLSSAMSLRPMPPIAAASNVPAPTGPLFEHYARRVSELTGAVTCCVFEVSSGAVIAYAGAGPAAPELAFHGSEIMEALLAGSRTLGLGHKLPDAAITLGNHHLLLRGVPRHPGVAIHALLDKTQANLTLVRLKLLRLDALFDEAPRDV